MFKSSWHSFLPLLLIFISISCNSTSERQKINQTITSSYFSDTTKRVYEKYDSLKNSDKKDCSLRIPISIPDSVAEIISKHYPEYHVAHLADFVNDWCYFYAGTEVPYFAKGNFKGNGRIAYVIVITSKQNALLIYTDNIKPVILDTLASLTENDTALAKFNFGVHMDPPGDFYDFETESTVHIVRDNIELNVFEKAATTYFWTGQNFKQITSGD